MKIDSFILLLFYPLLLIDSINGFFLLSGFTFPVSQLYKVALMLILGIRIMLLSSKLFFYLFSVLSFAFLQLFFVITTIGISYDGPLAIFTSFLKFYLFLLSYFYFKVSLKESFITKKDIYSICIVNFAVILCNIFVGLLGYGFPVYSTVDSEVSVGIKGFFFAGNELSAVFILLTSATLGIMVPKINKKYHIYIMVFVLFLLSATLATKTAIGGMLIISIATIMFNKKYIEKKSFNIKNIFFVGFSTLSISSVSIYFFIKSAAFERMLNVYNDFSNVYKFLMSGRDQFLSKKLFLFMSENSLFNFVFGVGEPFPVEMDLFDTFFRFGITGLFLVYFLYFFSNYYVFRYYLRKDGFFELSILNLALLLIFIQSFISGHVLFSGMAGPFYGMILALSFFIYKENFKD